MFPNKHVEITVREFNAKTGQIYIVPEIEVNTWWTSLGEAEETIIDLYHKHATSEQYHSEVKSDIGLEKFPSGKIDDTEFSRDNL